MLLGSTLSGHLTPGLGLALELELALEVLIWLEPVCLQQVWYTLLGVVPTGKGFLGTWLISKLGLLLILSITCCLVESALGVS